MENLKNNSVNDVNYMERDNRE